MKPDQLEIADIRDQIQVSEVLITFIAFEERSSPKQSQELGISRTTFLRTFSLHECFVKSTTEKGLQKIACFTYKAVFRKKSK